MKYLGTISDNKDLTTKEYVDNSILNNIDSSLLLSNKSAEAKAVGDALSALRASTLSQSGVLPSGSVANVFTNGFYALSSSNTYTGLPSGVSMGHFISMKPQTTSNYYAVHILIDLSENMYVQLYTTNWLAWKKINADLSTPTGEITVASGWTVSQSWCRKQANVVEYDLEVTSGTLSSGWNTIGTLPLGFRPSSTFYSVGVDSGSTTVPACSVRTTTTGLIQVYKLTNTSNNLKLHGMFIIIEAQPK